MAGVVRGGLVWQEVDASPACATAFRVHPSGVRVYVCDWCKYMCLCATVV
jgi:hypothetical protein